MNGSTWLCFRLARWVILGAFASLAAPSSAEIVFQDIEDVPLFRGSPYVFYSVDFNQDGIDDAVFRGSEGDFVVLSTVSSLIGGRRQQPPDIGNFARPFHLGELIESSLTDPWSWNSGQSTLAACRDIGCLGFWGSNIDYVGVQFTFDGNTHYGWVEVEVPFIGVSGGYVRSFAYETEADAPIIAGAIPEPSASVLILIGIGVAIAFHRSRKRGNKALQ